MRIGSLSRSNAAIVDSLQCFEAVVIEEGSDVVHGNVGSACAARGWIAPGMVLAVGGNGAADLLNGEEAAVGGCLGLAGCDPGEVDFAGKIRGGGDASSGFAAGNVGEAIGLRSGEGADVGKERKECDGSGRLHAESELGPWI